MQFESRLNYLRWQQRLGQGHLFRSWWQFWSNYSFLVFMLAFIYVFRMGMDVWLQMTLCAIVSFIIARWVIVAIINSLYHRVRPYQKYQFAPITSRFFSRGTKINNSFPSRHAAALSSIAAAVLVFNPAAGILLLGTVILTGIARVILGYHYPTDIIAGIIIGTSTGIAVPLVAVPALFT